MMGPQAGYNAECNAPLASASLPATRVQFGFGAVLQHSNTPARIATRSVAGAAITPRDRIRGRGRRRSAITNHPPLRYHRRRGLSLKTQLGRFEGVFLGHGGFSSVEAIKN
jgi:hypothetical protein